MIIDGTTYHDRTPAEVVALLERNRTTSAYTRPRLRLEYGDAETGRAWGDVETGYVGRSSGPVKVPIILHNLRSMGGGAISDGSIVRISMARGGSVLWQHPTYQRVDA